MLSSQESAKENLESSLDSPSKPSLLNSLNKDESRSIYSEQIKHTVLPRIQNGLERILNEETIRPSNMYIDDLKDKQLLITAIKLQIMAWRSKGNLVEQLRQAETLISMAPEDPEGYINAAEVHSIRGKQSNVIDIVYEGMTRISNINDSAYDKLTRQYHQAETRVSSRVDFLDQFPYDLTCKVVNHLPRESLSECSRVSRSWQDLILYYPLIWRIYSIERKNDASMLPNVTQHIEELSFRDEEGNLPFVIFARFMEILGSYNWNNEKHNLALSKVSSKVNDISLVFKGEDAISLSQFLMDFRNLISLEYYACSNTKKWVSVPTLPYTTILQKIYLKADDFSFRIESEEIKGLLSNSPHLRIITLINANESILSTIHQHCLNVIILNFDNSDVPVDDVAKRVSDDATGLHYLYLHYVSSVKNIKQLLETHWNTLRNLDFKPLSLTSFDPLVTITLPYIEELIIDMTCSPLNEQQLISLLQYCPSTRSLTLVFCYSLKMTTNVFQAIGLLQHLNTLVICNANVSVDTATATQVFQKLKQMKRLTIRYCGEMTYNLFMAVPHFLNLENICIYDQNNLTMDQLRNFISNLSISKNLRTILFSNMTLNADLLKEFQNNNSLKSITLRVIKGINEHLARQALPPQISLTFGSWAGIITI
ncbi:hypothetical protein BDA99DRAFT_531757 [Phascolomyces articulosus]|uniref:F-box domain-containing protein n=1 Tax=Phascolomyces articulosus TaxID=60185 RepID=A0AAD5KAM9_9FUNG|nr:hypothetical protein BDA99DRAFT_531757 [Phascolomyces articulosus]